VTFISATGGVTPVNGTLTFDLGTLPKGVTSVRVVVRPNVGVKSLDTAVTIRSNQAGPTVQNPSAAQVTPVVTPPGDGPRIVAIQRFGFHWQPTLLVLDFNADGLDPARVSDASNYTVTSAGPDGKFGTKDDQAFAIQSATYDATRQTVTLAFRQGRLYLYETYQIRVHGTAPDGLADTAGRYLDGNGDGRPGGDHVARFDRSNLAGRASKAPGRAAPVRSQRARDSTAAGVALGVHPLGPHRFLSLRARKPGHR
jgi:hypothetical protein